MALLLPADPFEVDAVVVVVVVVVMANEAEFLLTGLLGLLVLLLCQEVVVAEALDRGANAVNVLLLL